MNTTKIKYNGLRCATCGTPIKRVVSVRDRARRDCAHCEMERQAAKVVSKICTDAFFEGGQWKPSAPD